MPSNSSQLVDKLIHGILENGAELFHDEYDEAYIAYLGDGSGVSKLTTRSFKHWLANYCYAQHGYALTQFTEQKIVQTLAGKAIFEGKMRSLSVRHAFVDKTLWYDLGELAVKIEATGWKVINSPPILFKRFGHQKKQVLPQSGGNLDLLLMYVNLVQDDDKLLFLVYVVVAFLPGFPHPLLILHGPQGAGKSTPMRVMKELIDPSALSGSTVPRDVTAFVQLVSHHAFLFFDNLSSMPTWLSDALARASTGDGFSKRALYTDDDDIVYKIQKTIALNGISQVITKPDLLDRSILLKLERINSKDRKPEKTFWAHFEEDKPLILGAIFDTLSKAIEVQENLELEDLPRMADFATWGYAVAEAAGYKGSQFLVAYERNISLQNEEAIEASPVALALIIFMEDKDEWEGTPADLLHELSFLKNNPQFSNSYSWPKDPAWVTRRLNEVQPNLNAWGYQIEQRRTNKGRILVITKMVQNPDNPDTADTDDSDSMSVMTADEQTRIIEMFDH